MARSRRIAPGGIVQHVMNRGSRKGDLFNTKDDYLHFVRLLAEAREQRPMRILAYVLMRNHWHFLLWPRHDNELSSFMHWLTGTHGRQFRERYRNLGEGAVYQSRFNGVPIFDDFHLLTAWRYIERNPIEQNLVNRAEDWPWSSANATGIAAEILSLDPPPFPKPSDWLDMVNDPCLEWGTWQYRAYDEEPPAGVEMPSSRPTHTGSDRTVVCNRTTGV